jgi:competence protein ComEC
MADQGGARAREKALQPWGAAGRRPALAWRGRFGVLTEGTVAQRLRTWATSDVAPGRLLPWLAIAFGVGIVLYFTAQTEPVLWATLAAFVVAVAVVVLLRRRPVGFPIALAFAAMAAGFMAMAIRCAIVTHPVLQTAVWNAQVTGFVETREERERSDRIVVRVHRIDGPRMGEKPERVRVSVRSGTAPAVGAFVSFKARLTPPLGPLHPGGYDFAQHLYFQEIGASGFVLGSIKTVAAPTAGGFWLGYAAAIEAMRTTIDSRIRANVVGADNGSIASALITGKRDAISTPVNDAMYVSGLGHVLSISGYHMAMVVMIVLAVVRASLALVVPPRFPTKKWAALAALVIAAFYLLLSGAEVATQRSFIMVAIVMVGVMADRATLTLRTLTVAAFGVLLLAPESVLHPSFQMSFAATLALLSGYETSLRFDGRRRDTKLHTRIALWGGREILFLTLSSALAGTATMLFAAFHFHRLAPYGVIANLLAMPVVSVWVMPLGLIGLLLAPFGFDGVCWWLMGKGIDWMITVSLWVAGLPGAVGHITAFGVGPLLLGSAGLVLLCLLRSPLRFTGIVAIAAASLWAIRTPQPDVLIAPDGGSVAVRMASGRLAFVKTGSDTFAIQQWLAADADPRTAKDRGLGEGIPCDEDGCIGRLADGTIIAIARSLAALEEDCQRAALVVSTRTVPPDCAAPVIDPTVWRRTGALALRRVGTGWETNTARPIGYDRPWARAVRHDGNHTVPRASGSPAPPPDATPRPEDLEAGD